MKEYAFDLTVNYADYDKEVDGDVWFPSVDDCLVAVRMTIESEPKATSFVFSIVQRDHQVNREEIS